MNAIEIQDLSFSYSGSQFPIFSEFNWSVDSGDFWVIVGSNGSGKTSLIRLLLGLELPTRGNIRIFGKTLSKKHGFVLSPQEQSIRSQIGHVPQHLHFDQHLPIPALEVVEGGVLSYSFFQGLRKGLRHKQRLEICMDALSQVDMQDLAKQRFSSLSGGQKQRVLIARALATRAPILILDEPTASVDPNAARSIVHICRQLQEKHTILFISHDISVIPETCKCCILCLSPAQERFDEQKASLSTKPAGGSFPQKTIAHAHHVDNMSQEEILLLLYNHWGLNSDLKGNTAQASQETLAKTCNKLPKSAQV